MQTRNPFIDDLTKVANGAMGALTGMKDEVEARVRDQIAKILDGMDIPRRDEFDAVKAMAAKAREENEELKKQIAELQAKLGNVEPRSVEDAQGIESPNWDEMGGEKMRVGVEVGGDTSPTSWPSKAAGSSSPRCRARRSRPTSARSQP